MESLVSFDKFPSSEITLGLESRLQLCLKSGCTQFLFVGLSLRETLLTVR